MTFFVGCLISCRLYFTVLAILVSSFNCIFINNFIGSVTFVVRLTTFVLNVIRWVRMSGNCYK